MGGARSGTAHRSVGKRRGPAGTVRGATPPRALTCSAGRRGTAPRALASDTILACRAPAPCAGVNSSSGEVKGPQGPWVSPAQRLPPTMNDGSASGTRPMAGRGGGGSCGSGRGERPTHVLHVVIELSCVPVAVDPQEELAGQGQHLSVAVVELGRHQGGRSRGPQVQRAAVVQGLGAPCPGPAVLCLLVCAALPLTRQQGLPLSALAAALEAGRAAHAVPAGAPAAPGAVGAPVGTGRAAEAGLWGRGRQ